LLLSFRAELISLAFFLVLVIVINATLDPVPTILVCELIDVLLPHITLMVNAVNASLAHGRLPASQKCAIITPLLKKSGLDSVNITFGWFRTCHSYRKWLNEP